MAYYYFIVLCYVILLSSIVKFKCQSSVTSAGMHVVFKYKFVDFRKKLSELFKGGWQAQRPTKYAGPIGLQISNTTANLRILTNLLR